MPQACSNCGAALIGARKFCASCGTPAGGGTSVAPLASTMRSAPNPAAARGANSSMPPPVRSSDGPPGASQSASLPAPNTPTGARNTPIPTYPPPSYVSGARVLVQWSDGNRYPGLVQQVAPGQCLIVFPDGQQRWVANVYLSIHP